MTRVAVVFNDDLRLVAGNAQDALAVQGVVSCARAVTDALRTRGHAASLHALPMERREIGAFVEALDVDVVFNLVEAIGGDARLEPAFAWACELRALAYTGSPPRAMTLCLEKPLAQAILSANGIPVPRHVVMERGDEPLGDLRLPAIVKPSREDASHGIESASVVRDETALLARVAHVLEHYAQPAIVEEFVDGREINVALLAGPNGLEVLPLSEIDYRGFPPDMPRIVSYAGKWIETSRDWALTQVVAAADLAATTRDDSSPDRIDRAASLRGARLERLRARRHAARRARRAVRDRRESESRHLAGRGLRVGGRTCGAHARGRRRAHPRLDLLNRPKRRVVAEFVLFTSP